MSVWPVVREVTFGDPYGITWVSYPHGFLSLMTKSAELEIWCAQLGIDVPPVPEQFPATLRRLSPHAFAARELPWSPYEVAHWVSEEGAPEYLVVGHAGHGVNSYAVSYFLVQQHLRLFIQVGLGGVYMDGERSRRAVCEAFSAAALLIGAAELATVRTLLVVATEFYGSHWHAGDANHEAGTVLECIKDATTWLEAQR